MVAGLSAVAAYNCRLWQRDKALLASLSTPESSPPLESWPELPLVSVLVAAWNEGASIERHIESFLALRYPRKELVLCAGGTDGTYGLAQRHAGPPVTLLKQRRGEGKQRALAHCLPLARGEIIFLTDADCFLDDEAFERTLAPVAARKEQVCTGGSRPCADQAHSPFVMAQAASQTYSSMQTPDYAPGLLGRNCALRRELLEGSRGLLEWAPTGTDYVLAKTLARAGVAIRQMPSSRVETAFPRTPCAYARQQERWLANVLIHGLRFGAYGEAIRSLIPPAIGAGMLLGPLAAWRWGPAALAVWLLAWTHVLFSRVRYARFSELLTGQHVGPAGYLWLPVHVLLDFVVWAWAPARHLLKKRARTRW